MDYLTKSREELIIELLGQKQELDSLKVLFDQEINNRNQIEYSLKERLKELNCHDQIAEVMSNSELSIDEVCEKIVQIIPPSWQFPEIAEASIQIPNHVFRTPGYKPGKYSMVQDIKINQTILGQIEVCYPVDLAPDVDQLFLPEESSLLFSIAVKLGNYMENKEKGLALKVSEEKHKDLIENINDVIYTTDNQSNITFISPSITRLLGYRPEDVIGKNFSNFTGETTEHLKNRFEEIKDKSELQSEYQILSVTGEPHWIRFSSKAIIKEGQFVGVTGILTDITEKKQVELELQKSESLYRSILNASPDTIFIADLNGNVLFTSPMALKMFRYNSTEDLINRPLIDFIDERSRDKAQKAIMQMFQGIFSGADEYTGIKADGTSFEIEVNGDFIRNEKGKSTSMVFIVRDISDRKLAKEKAEESEQKFQAIIQSQAEGIGFVNKDEVFEFVNLAAGTIFEIDSDKLIGVSLFDFVTPGEKEKVMLQTGNRKSGNSNNYELEIVTRAGNTKFLQVSTTPKFDKNGNYLGAYGVFTDNTKRKLAEEKLQKSEEQYRKLVESVNDVIYEIDSIGNIRFVSQSVINILGYTVDEVLGRNIFDFIVPEDVPVIMNSLKSLASRDYSFMEYRYLRKDGTIRWVRSSTTANIKDGAMIGATGTLTDVTDRRIAEEKLKDKTNLLTNLIINLQEGILLEDSSRNIALTNQLFCNMFGIPAPPEALIGADCSTSAEDSKMLFKDPEKFISDIERILKNKKAVYNDELQLHDGRYMERDYIPTYIENKYNGHLWKYRDITERKLAEEKLRESEERFRMVFENVFDGISIFEENPDPLKRKLIECNEQFAAMAGRSRKELLEIGYTYSLTKTLIEDANRARLKGIAEQFAYHGSFAWIRPDGKDNSIEYIAKPVIVNGKSYSIGIDRDSTERIRSEKELKSAQENLRKSEQKFRTIAEQTSDLIAIADENGFITYSSNSSVNMFQISPEEMCGRNFAEFVDENEVAKAIEHFQLCMTNNGRIKDVEFLMKRSDGSFFIGELNGSKYITEAQNGILVTIRDITEKRKAEEGLRKLSQAVEQSPVSIVITDLEGNIEYANPKASETTGYTLDELKGKNPRVLKSGDTPTNEYQFLWDSISHGNIWKGIFHNKRKNGELYWESSQITPIIGENGNITNYLALKEDITDRKKTQEELARSENRFRQITEQSQTVIWEVDANGLYTFVSHVSKKVWGYEPDELVGKKYFYDLHPIEGREEFKESALKVFAERVVFNGLINAVVTQNQKLIWVLTNGTPIIDSEDNMIGYRGADNDITEKKLAEEALKESEEALNYAQRIANMGSWSLDLINNKLTWSNNYYHLLGLNPEDKGISNDHFIKMVHPDDAYKMDEKLQEIHQTKESASLDFRLIMPDGQIKWIQNNIVPVFEGDNLISLNGVNIDITEKKLTEEALRMNETALNQAQEISKMSSWEFNLLTGKLSWSKNFYQMMGIPLGTEMKTEFLLERVHPDDSQMVDDYLTILKETKKPVTYDIRLKLKNNEYKWIQNNIIPVLENDQLVALKGVNIDVTDKKLDEEKIKQQNDRLTAIINALPDIIFVSDREGTYLEYYNATSQSMLFDEHKLIGSSVRDVFDEKTANLHIQKINECLQQNRLVTYEYSAPINGSIQYFEARLAPIGNERVLRFVRDFTDKRLKDYELIKLSQAVEQSPVSIVITDLDAKVVYVNPSFETTSGYTSAEVVGKNTNLLKSGKTDQRVYQDLWETIVQGKEWKGEWINKKKNDEFYWEEISITPIHNSSGEVTNYLAIKQDISQRKHAEQEILELNASLENRIEERTSELAYTNLNLIKEIEVRKLTEMALAESEKSYRTVVENVNEVIFQTDAEGLWVFLNKSWEDITGFSVKDSLGQLFVNYVHPDDRARNWELFEPLIQRKKDYCRHQIRYLTKEGGFRWIEVFARLGLNENNEITGTFGTLMDITDRKMAEELRTQTQQNYETFFNTIDDFLFIFQENGTIVDVNKTVVDRLGYKPEEILNQSILFVRPTDRWEEALDVMKDILQDKISYCTIPLLAKRGIQIPVETRLKRGFWNGNPVIFGVSKDISQIKISEEKFASAFHSNSAVMTITRFDNDQFIDVNKAFINLLGYSREEIVGKTLTSLGIVKEFGEGEKIQSLIEKGIPVQEIEINAYSKSNELFIFLLSAEEIYVGLERCILSIAVNITERKQAEEQLQWNKSLLEMMSNSSPLGFLVVDNRTDEILYFNKRFCQIWGIENIEKQMLNGEFSNNDIIPYCLPVLVDIPAFAESCKPLQDENNRTVVSDEIPFTENRTIHRYTTQIRGVDDQYFGRFYIFEDITEEKQSKLELTNAKNEAEKANLAKSEFLSRMSHELRTPMNSILGFAQLLEMGELNARQSKGVNHIMKSGKHLLDLINEVLDISRIEAGRLSLSLEPVKLSGVIPEMIDIVKPQIIDRQIRIELIEAESNQMFVRSDRQRLKQILLNLLNNAIKYNRQSGSIRIKTELRPVNASGIAMLRISITDTGLGISEEDLPKLFKPFERIGAEKSATEGTGLGLSVVKKLIEAMSGKLGVESIPGIGSTFWIELPNSESPLENVEKSGILKELEPNLANLSGTILYIEDNASNIELVEQILTNQRSKIKLISNMTGAETVQMAIAYRPDLILLDLNLPDLHGSKVLSQLLAEEQTKNIPVVVISADAMPQQLERLLKGGAKDYLTKPLDVQEFLLMIDKYIPHQMQ